MTEVTKKYGIAEWRIDSDEERTLAKKADCSEEGKRQLKLRAERLGVR